MFSLPTGFHAASSAGRRSGRLRRSICCLALCLALLGGCKAEVYQGLSEQQANEMLALLLKYGISSEKKQDKTGFKLSVDDTRIVQALEILHNHSLPRENYQNLGQVFTGDGMISSSTEDQARLTYAISQELAGTFATIDGVLTARVHVVLASTDLSTGTTTAPSAAVFLRHVPESQVTRLVSNIRELTANAVPGLKIDGVSVMLVPIRENITVPMTQNGNGADNSHLLQILAGCLALLAAGCGALGFLLFRARRKKKGIAADATPQQQA